MYNFVHFYFPFFVHSYFIINNTFTHSAKKLEAVWETDNKSLASKLEYAIKKLTKVKKEELIKNKELKTVFSNNTKIDVENYRVVRNQ